MCCFGRESIVCDDDGVSRTDHIHFATLPQMADAVKDTQRIIELVERIEENIVLNQWALAIVVIAIILLVCPATICSSIGD